MKILAFIIYFFLSLFIVGNILLPLFYAIPRLIKEKRTIVKAIIAPIINIIVIIILFFVIGKYFPTTINLYYYAIGTASIVIIFGSKKKDMEADFVDSYSSEVDKEEEVVVVKSFIKSAYENSKIELSFDEYNNKLLMIYNEKGFRDFAKEIALAKANNILEEENIPEDEREKTKKVLIDRMVGQLMNYRNMPRK